jgi:electron-transferring-flavoprotein dehydrogenase
MWRTLSAGRSRSDLYGGGWIYGMRDNRVSLGMVVGLEYHNPLFDPHAAFQKFKTHPFRENADSRRRQTRPLRRENGSLRRLVFDAAQLRGWRLIIGDSASLLNSQRLKGIHTAIKSGMLAAETIYEACARRHFRDDAPHIRKKSKRAG